MATSGTYLWCDISNALAKTIFVGYHGLKWNGQRF